MKSSNAATALRQADRGRTDYVADEPVVHACVVHEFADVVPPFAIEFRGVTRTYGSGGTRVVALDDVSIDFPMNSWTAVMGPSGSGKSTLLHIAGGLEKATSGEVLVAGRDITHASESQLTILRRSAVGFIFQNFNLIGSLSAEQNVAMPARLAGRRPSREAVQAALAEVGLGDRIRHKPRELSGGQQQRVAIARALVSRPAVLLADEPTGALDSNAARTVLGMLRSIVDAGGQTIVMVTHDPKAAACADDVLFVSDGRIAGRMTGSSPTDIAERLACLEG
jgi:putative ABC transport system ATP-binding protein